MVDKIFRIETIVSQYDINDEGFWNIKTSMELAKGVDQLKESVNIVNQNIDDYIKRRVNND